MFVNNNVSRHLPVLSGVPQGSILGPLLFLIFVNDLQDCLCSADILLFADDTKCLHKINHLSDCDSLQCDLNNLSTWNNLWNLHFNSDKCVVVRYSSNPTPILQDYYFDKYKLVCKNSHRYLGLTMSANLCWKDHYDNMLARAYRTIGLLCRTFNNVSCILAKKVLYISLVRSQFRYCYPAWRPNLIKDIIPLEKLQEQQNLSLMTTLLSTRID